RKCTARCHVEHAIPRPKRTAFEQAQYCDAMVRDKAGVRDADLRSGVLRWKCGDVDGVTYDERRSNGFGQEYCEYHAVSNGVVADGPSSPTGPVQCVFSSVFRGYAGDARPLAAELRVTLASPTVDAAVAVTQID